MPFLNAKKQQAPPLDDGILILTNCAPQHVVCDDAAGRFVVYIVGVEFTTSISSRIHREGVSLFLWLLGNRGH